MVRVLFTDAQPRMTLAAVRSLGKRGVEVYASEKTRFAPALFSKYCRKALVSPNPQREPEAYLEWLVRVLKEFQIDVFFPVDDPVLELVVANREKFAGLCHLPLPPTESFRIAADKGLTIKEALEAGLNCPETVFVDDLDQLTKIAESLEYPVIIKPRKSSGSRGIKKVTVKEDLCKSYLEVHGEYPFPLIQKYITTRAKYSVGVLFNKDSQLRASFVQKQLRHYPLDTGTSVVQESVWYPELLDQALKFFGNLKWYGLAELEFIIDDKSGKPLFTEINPRFWGCIYMAILAGVDFPWLLYEMAVKGDIEGVYDYQKDLRCRWLLPGDILHFLANPNRGKMNPPFLAGKKYNVYDDTLSWEDPLPILGFSLACLRYLFDRDMWKFILKV